MRDGTSRQTLMATMVMLAATAARAETNLVVNGGLEDADPNGKAPRGFVVSGDALYGDLGDRQREHTGRGVRFQSASTAKSNDAPTGSVSCRVTGLTAEQGRWYQFRIRGLAQEDFKVQQEALSLKVEFFKNQGRSSLDSIQKSVFAQVELDREKLRDNGTNRNLGSATWREYELIFRTPFPEVDAVELSVGFAQGSGRGARSEFWVDEFELIRIADPADYVPPPRTTSTAATPDVLQSLVKLGGRWYYDPRAGSRTAPNQFDHTNADRLLYLSDRLEAPFANNTTSWLRKGYLDRAGKPVTADRFVPDNVLIAATDTHLIVKSKNLPNHPTAVFPDRSRSIDGNPNFIREQDVTWHLPLEPKVNPNHIAMNASNSNRALPGGPIGIATNGVVFFNPFDADSVDAIWRLDRCCGHPSPGYEYHYHKYPVCVKTPWADDGEGHSPVIGFAFDGFPVYGPYESKGQLARDSKTNPLNEFNVHQDAERGWHYHVTPGEFPHVLGGYWGEADSMNRRRGPPGGGGPPGGKKKGPPPRL